MQAYVFARCKEYHVDFKVVIPYRKRGAERSLARVVGGRLNGANISRFSTMNYRAMHVSTKYNFRKFCMHLVYDLGYKEINRVKGRVSELPGKVAGYLFDIINKDDSRFKKIREIIRTLERADSKILCTWFNNC